MAYTELLTRVVSRAQSKYEIVEKNINQQNSYNLDLKVMQTLKLSNAIKETENGHFEVEDGYKIELGKGILDLIGSKYNECDLGIRFIHTKSEGGTEKFQIKRTDNKFEKYEWFCKLYDKNYEGAKFKVYLNSEDKIIKFDIIPPVDLNQFDYQLVEVKDYQIEHLSQKLIEYYKNIKPQPTGICLFGIDYYEVFIENPDLEKILFRTSGIDDSFKTELHKGISIAKELRSRSLVSYNSVMEENNTNLKGFNKIYYGIPGCGKSYKISAMLSHEEGFIEEAHKNGIENPVDEKNIIRTTFYLDYSNSDFIGQIYPVVKDGKVTYSPVPGPFTKALEKAYENPNTMVYLVIEEINRGNAAAIFGDTFQLLDRLKKDKNGRFAGESEYPITNEFIEGYFRELNKEREKNNMEKIPFEEGRIIIPRNLTIFATMNTSDQNVFPLDTAFKRRWNKEKVVTDWDNVTTAKLCIPFTDWTWGEFAKSVNILMISNSKEGIITEDKNLGPYFVNEDMLVEQEHRYDATPENEEKLLRFVNNVIDYLYLDVSKFEKDVLFNESYDYGKVYETFISLTKSVVTVDQAQKILSIFSDKIPPNVQDQYSKVKENAKEVK